MTAKDRRKVKHALKTSVDMADIWLKLANEVRTGFNIDSKDLNPSSKQTVISELEQAKKEISEYSSKFITEIEASIASLR